MTGGSPPRNTPAPRVGGYETPYGWDWSQTTHEGSEGIVDDLLAAMNTHVALETKGLYGYSLGVQSYDRGGYLNGTVYFGGGRDDVHVQSTSQAADETRARVLSIGNPKTSRVDTRVDCQIPFEDLCWILQDAASIYGSDIIKYERISGRGADRGSTGRTCYLGAPSSAVRIRVYEKWLESGGGVCPVHGRNPIDGGVCSCQYVKGTNRVEVMLRPASKVKQRVSGWTPAETFAASKVAREVAKRLGDDFPPVNSLHVQRDTPDLERTLRVMGQQYGPAFRRFLTHGDLDTAMGYLLDPTPEADPAPEVKPAAKVRTASVRPAS